MKYINTILVALLLSSCSSSNPERVSDLESSGNSPLEHSNYELSKYKNAILLLNNGELLKAKNIFTDFTEDRPELAGPYANLAVIAIRENKPNDALQLIKISLQRNHKAPKTLNLLAYLEQSKGEIKSAEKHYKEAIKYNKNYAIAHYNLAVLYDIYLQDIESAIPHYETYMKLIGNKDKNTADWLEQIKHTRDKS